jgi:putative FmdB family regulatory protein
MPLYEYRCERCGEFEGMRSMAEAAEPSACPDCGEPSARILSAVRGAQLAASEVRARDRNEQSRHEPRVVQKPKRAARDPAQRPKLQRAHGSRPWALEHGG